MIRKRPSLLLLLAANNGLRIARAEGSTKLRVFGGHQGLKVQETLRMKREDGGRELVGNHGDVDEFGEFGEIFGSKSGRGDRIGGQYGHGGQYGQESVVGGIDFSSSFSDETHSTVENSGTNLNSDDDVEFLRALSCAEGFKTPKSLQLQGFEQSVETRDVGDKNWVEKKILCPNIHKANIIDSSSPIRKKNRVEMTSPVQQVRHLSSTKKIEQLNPTIQLVTQRSLGTRATATASTSAKSTSNSSARSSIKPEGSFKAGLKSVKPIRLSGEQEYILQLALKGKSLFYTGSAGTGKSVLLRSIIKALKQKYDKGKVAVTASTGLAACNIGGITLHSFAGVGLGDASVESLMKKLKRNKKAYTRWCQVKVLVIDEISMIDGHFLNKLDYIAKMTRKNNRPFGGIQIITCGDFYQLPPVNKANSISDTCVPDTEEAIFSFESRAWKEAIKCTIILKEVFRQRGDQRFIDMLNGMRSGKVDEMTVLEFNKLSRSLEASDGIEPAELFSTRYEVENANNTRLTLLKGATKLFKGMDSGSLSPDQRMTVLNNFLAPQKLFLKVNAQVMCIKNFDETLVNGSLGQVVGFMDRDTYMHYNVLRENPDATLEEVKKEANKRLEKDKSETEELTADASCPSINDSVFDFLETENELVSSLEDSFDDGDKVHAQNKERKIGFIRNLNENSEKLKYPLVRFLLPDGYNTREVLVEPEEWTVEDENEKVLARRIQLPLILAWSLSIHKSQGQTLPKVKVDLKRVFEKGQAYVALSRAVSRDGLQVLNFSRDKIMAHPKVNAFYTTLSSTEELASDNDDMKPQIRPSKPNGKRLRTASPAV